MRILAFDLETSPMLSWHWGRWSQDIRPDQTVQESRVLCFGARWVGSPKFIFKAEYEHGRAEMLTTIHDLLSEADAVMSWNGKKFDTKKIKTEFVLEGMAPPPAYHDLDLMLTAKSQFAFSSNKLDHVAQQLGVGQKVHHEGFGLWLKVMNGDPKARALFRRYQKGDVDLLVDLYEKLRPWVTNHPNAALIEGLERGCRVCAGNNFQSRGPARTATGTYQRYQCQDCGTWNRGSHRITTTELRSA